MIDEALLMRWKTRLCDEMDELYHEDNWTPTHVKTAKNLLKSIDAIMCIVKTAKDIEEK